MNVVQQPLTVACDHEWLTAIVSRPRAPHPRGVLIVVGGPQYRVGSHRQFALLANHLAQHGTAVMRFDYGGMGDSTGELKNFEQAGPDVRAAIDAFFAAVPQLQDIVIWGLCDAASAALFCAHRDPRVSGVVLANPWVRTAHGQAQTYLRHYYLGRLVAPALWRKLWLGEFSFATAARSLAGNIARAFRMGHDERASFEHSDMLPPESAPRTPLPDRMADGLRRFEGRVLLILSGNDLTAKEFIDVTRASKSWRKLLKAARVTRYDLPAADHTFSRRDWRDQVAAWTAKWLAL